MMTTQFPPPLELAKQYGIPQRTVAAILDVSVSWLQVLGRDPRYARRLRVAVLQAALEREKEQAILDGLARSSANGEAGRQ